MIGIFDSGIGGLTAAKAIMDTLPGYDILYFGDTARSPYGSKSAAAIEKYTHESIDFLVSQGAGIIVVACHSASSTGIDHLKKKYDLPVFDIVTSSVCSALDLSKNRRFGVIGTRVTVDSGIYERTILKKMPDAKVYSAACPLLVPLIEEKRLKKPETRMIVKKYLSPLKVRQIDTLIPACNHYPLLEDIIQEKIGKKVAMVDPSFALASRVKAVIDQKPSEIKKLSKTGDIRFFVSDITGHFKNLAQFILDRKVALEPAPIAYFED